VVKCSEKENHAIAATGSRRGHSSCFLAPLSMPLLLKAFELVHGKGIDFRMPLRALGAQLLLVLLLPAALGIILRYSFPVQVSRHEKKLRRFSLVAPAFLIGFIVYQTRQLLLMAWNSIAGAAACFVFLSMAAGYVVGFFFRLNRTDRQTLVIEFGVRNVATNGSTLSGRNRRIVSRSSGKVVACLAGA
jgi:predicted Na+-dependent transporter